LILLILFLFGSTTTQTAVIAQVSNDTAAPGTTTNPEPSPAVPGTTTNPDQNQTVPGDAGVREGPANIPFFWIAPTIAIVMGALGGGLALRKHSKHSKTPSSPVIEPVPESVVNVIAQGGIEDLPNRPVNSSPIPNDSGTNTIVSKEIEVITQGGVER
jgi:hypothetical protein